MSCQAYFCWKCVKLCFERTQGSNYATQFSLKFHWEEVSRGRYSSDSTDFARGAYLLLVPQGRVFIQDRVLIRNRLLIPFLRNKRMFKTKRSVEIVRLKK